MGNSVGCGWVRPVNGEAAPEGTRMDEAGVGGGERLGVLSLCACWTMSDSCCRTSAMSVMGGLPICIRISSCCNDVNTYSNRCSGAVAAAGKEEAAGDAVLDKEEAGCMVGGRVVGRKLVAGKGSVWMGWMVAAAGDEVVVLIVSWCGGEGCRREEWVEDDDDDGGRALRGSRCGEGGGENAETSATGRASLSSIDASGCGE